MKKFTFLLIGLAFGFILVKGEVISWYRIYEMFRFQSFHMYGVIGSAVVVGALLLLLARKTKFKNVEGQVISVPTKPKNFVAALVGGSIFGLGWALTGACPAPMFILAGYGYSVFFLIIFFALLGAFLYGLVRNSLPH